MKSFKSILAFCALAAIPAIGDVEALYWQVDSSSNPENIAFTYAALVGIDGDNRTYIADESGVQFHNSTGDGTTTDVIASIMDPSYSTWSFYIELWNYDNGNWTLVGNAGGPPGETYTKLKDDGVIRSSMSMDTKLFTPTAAVPEPTSGLLVLLGGALLALRRRRSAAA